ncbi:hypothetical protein NC653_003772 [Populus alba x Populus x berolinensis]|uniref:Uncharacterized protein n=1 Tax=Populus alba x Populus x berolinensis TaxID=444605 RepID=A0AAD6RSB8_9ROSI|nr:hypothetical protein NC653_003772 [Populus alba x Populus x berolinensis]
MGLVNRNPRRLNYKYLGQREVKKAGSRDSEARDLKNEAQEASSSNSQVRSDNDTDADTKEISRSNKEGWATNSSSVSVLKYAWYNCSMIGWIKAQSDAPPYIGPNSNSLLLDDFRLRKLYCQLWGFCFVTIVETISLTVTESHVTLEEEDLLSMWAIVYLAQMKPLIVPILSEGE